MSLFSSPREKRLWFWALAVLVAIYSTLLLGQPLARLLTDQGIIAAIFMLGLLVVGATVLVHGLKVQSGKAEIAVWLGIFAVYLMFFLRMALPERSHLIEYSVLAIFIYQALIERASQGSRVPVPALLAIIATALIGLLDECIQIFLPSRVFDPTDILFNTLAALMAIGSSLALTWARGKIRKS